MSKKPDYDYYTWKKFDKDCAKIARWAKDKHFKNIYGIPRGGLIVAVKLSHLLELPLILNQRDISNRTLIVDDIVDKGDALARLLGFLLHLFPRKVVMSASLYLGANPLIKPDLFLHKKTNWIVFPWETLTSSRYDGTF